MVRVSHSIDTISRVRYVRVVWEIELSDEVTQWYIALKVRDRAFADRALDRLAVAGARPGDAALSRARGRTARTAVQL
jgi:hypothetical protein